MLLIKVALTPPPAARKAGPYSHDIALLELAVKGDGCGVRFSPLVSPVCLPRPHTQFSPSSVCHVAGWGRTKCKSETSQSDTERDLTVRH